MKPEDLIKGEYYHVNEDGDFAIFVMKEVTDRYRVRSKYFIGTFTNLDFKKQQEIYIIGRNPRLATPEEKHWLDLCISNNKLMDKPAINSNPTYEIY